MGREAGKNKIFVNNPWQENTVVLYDETGEAAVVDCGCFSREEEAGLQEFLELKSLRPVLLLNTHLHPDHIFGNNFMKEVYGLSTKAAREDDFLVDGAVEVASMLGIKGIAQPPAVGEFLQGGDTVRFGQSEMVVIAVGGHSPGGLCFYSERDKLLLSGDVLFAGSIGRSDLPGGNGKDLIEGIRKKLFVLPEEVKVIPGHGPVTTIGEEKRHNPFFI